MGILHLSAFLLSGLSAPGQDVLWIIDEDDIAANVAMLTDLTELFARISASYSSHTLGHLRCGTTATVEDGRLAFEDLAAIADLTTGALGELCTGFVTDDVFPRKGPITPFAHRILVGRQSSLPRGRSARFQFERQTTILESAPSLLNDELGYPPWDGTFTRAASSVLPTADQNSTPHSRCQDGCRHDLLHKPRQCPSSTSAGVAQCQMIAYNRVGPPGDVQTASPPNGIVRHARAPSGLIQQPAPPAQ